jgi:hypothetical protein
MKPQNLINGFWLLFLGLCSNTLHSMKILNTLIKNHGNNDSNIVMIVHGCDTQGLSMGTLIRVCRGTWLLTCRSDKNKLFDCCYAIIVKLLWVGYHWWEVYQLGAKLPPYHWPFTFLPGVKVYSINGGIPLMYVLKLSWYVIRIAHEYVLVWLQTW